ncbi:hypothetical protein MED193_20479 [Roseobacter sp. MED193]|uniref:pentapeptide repeat-containing protein n=1 Tax=Roseobacter sp. MED193 TaxID=314262 RepID=UPI000068B848|nr:pentapeptide repeat-containing protein [Roseobacter sp. MED193]EAQ47607.1 hypothetical protein MED193_20479 [Roseobacter sp. MED193]
MRDESEAQDVPRSKLKPANENPWYVLMTLYGEQEGRNIDPELHEANRKAWNAWAGQKLSDEICANSAKKAGIEERELSAWGNCGTQLRLKFCEEYSKRNPNVEKVPGLPEPNMKITCGDSVFSKTVDLRKFVIPSEIDLCSARFEKDAIFQSTVFLSEAWFSHATFYESAFFNSARFIERAVFYGSMYFKRCDFVEVIFEGSASFERCYFEGVRSRKSDAYFYGCNFQKPATFRNAVFRDTYPDFAGAELHEKTSFTAHYDPLEIELDLGLAQRGNTYWPKKTMQDPETARETCATIRHILAKQGLPEDEHFFFRREMHFAGQIGSIWQRLPYLLFGLFSDYGHSIARPALWLAGLWAFGFVAFWGYLAGCCVPAPLEAVERPMGAAMGLSFSNLFPLFGFGRTFLAAELAGLPAVLKVISGFQTVFSVPLLFFLGLGLRQRFRLR